ncbi:imidazole glycerol phosphate synthase subunit HisH [Azospirillum thermophilum]|nr:imidazole glycerol phosphate synthase subunit HisH [Azospirillum thermophilum]
MTAARSSLPIVIVDYGLGNLFNLERAFLDQGAAEVLVSGDPAEIAAAQAIVLPGVGAFKSGMRRLEESGLASVLRDAASKTPMLGICLGMQLLLDASEEDGHWPGLGIVPGRVRRIEPEASGDAATTKAHLKVPHMGWNAIEPPDGRTDDPWAETLLEKVPPGSLMYFLHSYVVEPEAPASALAITRYGRDRFCSVLRQDRVMGCQFHPERSGSTGRAIIRSFLNLAQRT